MKAARQAVTRTARNKPIRSAVKTYVKNARAALDTGADEAADTVRQAVSQMDRAAQKGIIHRNAAARRKSRLMRRLHSLSITKTVGDAEAKAEKAEPAAKAKPARASATASATKAAPKTSVKTTKAAPAKAKSSARAKAPAKAVKSK